MTRAALLVLSLGGVLLAGTGRAAEPDLPLRVQADRIEVDQKTMTSRYLGHVVIERGNSRIEARRATVVHRDQGVERATAEGAPARFVHLQDDGTPLRGEARTVEYAADEDLVRLSGAARVERGEDTLEGERIDYFPSTGRLLAGDGTGRVLMTLKPLPSRDRRNPGP
jgi:lipopolysaccharide export system protein LptA